MSDRLFKLDTNIDGNYSDVSNTILSVENFIQVVNASDGSGEADPDINGKLSTTDGITDLTTVTSISGHGIIYNNAGEVVGEKGNLVIRDGLGNNFSFKTFRNSTVQETADKQIYMRDASVANYLVNADSRIALDNLINGAEKTVVSPGNGNLVQIARKDSQNKNKVFIDTVNLSETNIVVVSGKVTANKETVFDLVDTYPGKETVLATVFFTPRKAGYVKPAFINWSGTLEFYDLNQDAFDYYEDTACEEEVTKEDRTTVYNSYYKRHFIESNTDVNTFSTRTHRLTLKSRDGSVFEAGDLNIIVFDGTPSSAIRQGYLDIDNKSLATVFFDEAFPESDYSVSLAASGFVESWYSNKRLDGFTVNLERNFTGRIYWTAVYSVIKELI
jgi:hypothetical protein